MGNLRIRHTPASFGVAPDIAIPDPQNRPSGERIVFDNEWQRWLRRYFRQQGLPTASAFMAKFGREQYGICKSTNKKVCRALAKILIVAQGDELVAHMTAPAAPKPAKRKKEKNKDKKPSTCKPSFQVKVGTRDDREAFYASWEWKRVRYEALKRYGAKCQLCGQTKEDGVRICVDHIKPLALYPELALDINNLQILCDDCNMGKGRHDMTDWRK